MQTFIAQVKKPRSTRQRRATIGRPKGAKGVAKFPNGRKNRITEHQCGHKLQLGYVLVYAPSHPFSNSSGYVQQHRLVALAKDPSFVPSRNLVVHHIDGNKANNSPENLQIVTQRDHIRIHNGWKLNGDKWFKRCSGCERELQVDIHFGTYRHNSGKVFVNALCHPCKIEKSKGYYRLRNLPDNQTAQRLRNDWKLIDDKWFKTCPDCLLLLEFTENNFGKRSGKKCKPCEKIAAAKRWRAAHPVSRFKDGR